MSSTNGSLTVLVSNCTNVPNQPRFGLMVDPFVSVEFQGIKKRTAYKKSELNPVWNEKLVFDLNGSPLLTSDFLDIELKDYENLGANKLLAKGTVPLAQLINHGSLKYQVDLTDTFNNRLETTKLFLNLEYQTPTTPLSNAPKPAPIAGGDVTQEQPSSQTTQQQHQQPVMMSSMNDNYSDNEGQVNSSRTNRIDYNQLLSNKPQDFQVRIKVFEARQLDGNNIHPMCRIACAHMNKFTKTIRSTNNPYWDEVFFFNFSQIAPADFFDRLIEFRVYDAQSYLKDALIGSFKMDIGYCYNEPNHSLICKWLLLGDAEDCMSGAKGYLKVTINVLGPGDEAPFNVSPSIEDDIESNLLKPAGMMLRPATFIMKVFRAEDLPRMDSMFFHGIKSIFSNSEQKKELIDPYVVFAFAGKKVQSKIIYNNANPEWNQELKIGLKFPSMCDKLTITVKDWDRSNEDDINAVFYLPVSLISDLHADGFMPTFGPCFVNMYGAPREYSEFPTRLDELNLGRGEGVAYRGRLLFEIQTILGESPAEPISDIKLNEVLRIDPFLHRKKYKLHAAFFDATMISEIERSIEFEVSIGNYGNKLDENVPPSSSTTPPCNAVFDGSSYYFLPWANIKPCMQISSFWEDISYRIEALNFIKRFKRYVESCVTNIQTKLEMIGDSVTMNSPEMSQLAVSMLKMLDNIRTYASTNLPEPQPGRHHPNELDRMMRKMRIKSMRQIEKKCQKLPNMEFKMVVEEFEGFQRILSQLEQEPQNSIPDVIIWMLCGNERTAYYRIPAHELMYSANEDFKGDLCGKMQTIILKWPGKEAEDKVKKEVIPAQIRVKLWLGLERDEKDWLQMHIDEELNGAISIFAETYENQIYHWTSRKWTSDGLSRPNFSDSTGKVSLPKEKFKLPGGWEWKGDWEIAPELSLLFDKDAGHSQYMEEVYENNHRNLPGASWSINHLDKKPFLWSDYRGEKIPGKDEITLDEGWEWVEEWTVDLNRAVDNEGWEYCVDPSMGGWSPSEKVYHLSKRRRWIRTRNFTQSFENKVLTKKNEFEKILKEGWEYSKLFSTKFHAKEDSADTVRRRRWHRAMQPVDKNADLNAVFRIENNVKPDGIGSKDTDKLIEACINLNAPRMFIKYKNSNFFQLRAYIYQARSLLAGDTDTSLSDPYCQIVFVTHSAKTEIIKRSLSPTWDQTLIFESIEIHGDPSDIAANPPQIMIEIFDHDFYFFDIGIGEGSGKPDFLGRCQATPTVHYDKHDKQCKLEWLSLKRNGENAGEILAAFELFYLDTEKPIAKCVPPLPPKTGAIYKVPSGIRPELQRTMIEVLSWGVRNMTTFQLSDVDCPQVIFECGDHKLESEVIKNVKQHPNFSKPVLYFDVFLPKEELYIPPMSIKVLDHRHFGRKPIVGVHTIKSLGRFRVDREKESIIFSNIEAIQNPEQVSLNMEGQDEDGNERKAKKKLKNFFRRNRRDSKFKRINKAFGNYDTLEVGSVEEDIDWWSKFYSSLGENRKSGSYLAKGYEKIIIYNDELEKNKKFDHFRDFCEAFNLFRGKTNSEEENEIVGEFKGMFKIYPIPENSASTPTENMIFRNVQPMHKEECIVRVYVIRGIDLQSKDSNGKSDPYIQIECGKTKIDNRSDYIPNTINPEFGRMFEFKAILPLQKDLCIRVKDYDLISTDETIGETWIDIENRLLTKHRATCGLPSIYYETGPNRWRDSRKPSQILADVCKLRNLTYSLPKYVDSPLVIDKKIFTIDKYERHPPRNHHVGPRDERLCLYVLQEFNLVPEHVETRRLYNPIQPGMEQGKLQMWIDMFPRSLGAPGQAFNVEPRKPKNFLLRVVVWNTSDVICDDVSITGEKMSDIYVKGWLQGLEEDKQKTDVHYRSMDGDGNFNWRFVFNFNYLPAEQNIVVRKKEHFWSLDETETKLPPILNIQVWDNDKFSADDFLGQLSLNLNHMIRPAKEASDCGLKQLPEISSMGSTTSLTDEQANGESSTSSKQTIHLPHLPHLHSQSSKFVSLFEQRRLKGWWPCIVEHSDKRELAGKCELEIEILTEEEAQFRPAGKGREEPNQNPRLEPPNRPETSFLWLTSPYKSFRHILWRRYKWWVITITFIIITVIFLLLFFYTFPGALWNKIL